MQCEWESCVGVLTRFDANWGRLGRTTKSTWSWIFSARWKCAQMCWNETWYKICFFFKEIWMLVACFSVWHVWTIRCMFVSHQRELPCGEVLLNIWFELVSWLRGQYNSIEGNSDEAKRGRSKFLLKWGHSPMMVKSLSGPKQNYQAPRWLFLPLASISGQEM